ncbi:hypothetical protein KJA15_03835 [Patescibacteria group bacterium]|nr:hypothetical protein [Patescibacteria group bacterium]
MGNYKFQSKFFEKSKFLISNVKEEIATVNQKIYSKGKSQDSPGGFGFDGTRKINFGTL